jgi:MFS transporter, ACS family, hexuronate transporter
MASRLRWLVLSVFVLSTALNYLDRLLLAALAPTIKSEFHLSNTQYGGVISVFSIVYALTAPVAGWFIDRAGLNAGIMVSMAVWSAAGMATGWTRSLGGLLASRTVLGIGEAAGIPCAGKANGVYLQPRELAFGTALNQVGITIGMVAAPLMVAAMAPVYGWRSVFVVCGALGFVWIPVWWVTTKSIPAKPVETATARGGVQTILRDRRIWGLAAANALVMTLYTLWTNWTTLYFVEQYHLTEIQANEHFVWIPTLFATLGGFGGGWMAFRTISITDSIKSGRAETDVLRARLRICWLAAAMLLLTAAVPLMPTPALAVALISFSFFWCLAISTNLYAMPIDFFGAGHAAFAVSILTASYGLMQTVLSPLIGSMVDHFGFTMVCVVLSVMPLAGIGILRASTR